MTRFVSTTATLLAVACLAALLLCSGAAPAGSALPIPDIFVMNADGADIHDVTNTPDAWDIDAAWSPDGTALAYAASTSQGRVVILIDPNGTNPRTLYAGTEPDWSPDGTKIAVAADNGATRDILLVNADGSGHTNLTNTPDADDTDPSWSPDGQQIVFASGTWPARYDLYTMNADGTNVTRLTDAGGTDVNPAWSPDGTRIAFARRGTDPQGRTTSDLLLINPDGSALTKLTDDLQFDDDPAWSPDGTKIAFTRNPYTNGLYEFDIFSMNSDGSGLADVSNTTGSYDAWYDADPAWAPDGTRIAFDRSDPSLIGHPPPPPPPPPATGKGCRVPRVVGLRLGSARTKIRRAHCTVGAIRKKTSSTRAGRVISQRPKARTKLRRGGVVRLVVSRGPRR